MKRSELKQLIREVIEEMVVNESHPKNYDSQLQKLTHIAKTDGLNMFYEFGAGRDISDWIQSNDIPEWAKEYYPNWTVEDFKKLLSDINKQAR